MLFSFFFCLLSFLSASPFNSAFFLLISLVLQVLFIVPGQSFWVYYFLALLFLSGVFVVLLYLSSLSVAGLSATGGFSLIFLFLVSLRFHGGFSFVSVASFYSLYFTVYYFLVFFLVYLILFYISLSVSGSGGSLRKLFSIFACFE